MLRSLKLSGVGPAPEMEMDLGRRLNVMTGDNGLGKSFVLDVIWWALSGTWAGLPAWPRVDAKEAKIEIGLDEATAVAMGEWDPTKQRQTDREVEDGHFRRWSTFDVRKQEWVPYSFGFTKAPLPALILFARVDGTLALWDPYRNHYKLRPSPRIGVLDGEISTNPAFLQRPPAYILDQAEVLNGKDAGGKSLCNGLISDWVTWSLMRPESAGGQAFEHLSRVLSALSPDPETERIKPGAPRRMFVDDSRQFPTIDTGYGDVPILHASAGMRRIVSLAYFLVWAWHEHVEASRLLKEEPVKNIVFLMDEVENHLHPEWQRRIVPALLGVLESLAEGMSVQAHLTTHAPMILASLEPHFDPERDRLFSFDLKDGRVTLHEEMFTPRGDASRWLTSPAFKLRIPRSIEAERAMDDANAMMRGEEPARHKTREEIDRALHEALPGQDPFWPRWLAFMDGPAT